MQAYENPVVFIEPDIREIKMLNSATLSLNVFDFFFETYYFLIKVLTCNGFF